MGLLTTLLELIGLALVVAGVAMLSIPAGFVVAGVGLIALGVALAPTRPAAPAPPEDPAGGVV